MTSYQKDMAIRKWAEAREQGFQGFVLLKRQGPFFLTNTDALSLKDSMRTVKI